MEDIAFWVLHFCNIVTKSLLKRGAWIYTEVAGHWGMQGKEGTCYIAILSPRQERYLDGWWLESNPPGRPYPLAAEEGARKERKGLAMLDVGGYGLPGGSQGEEGLARELLGDIRSGNPPLIYAPPGVQ